MGEARLEIGDIHRQLRALGRDRAELDAAEAHYLRAGHSVRIWEAYGFASYAAYLEAVVGYGRKTARERIRTALALAELPAMAEAMADGEISWTQVRELSRVATGDTENDWLAVARGRSAREVGEMVAGLARGDRPGTIADRSELPRTLAFEVSPETYAMVREAIRVARQSMDGPVDDDVALGMVARGFLAEARGSGGDRYGNGDGDGNDDGHGRGARPGYQVAVSRCDDCARTFAEADGHSVQLDSAMVAAIECDHTAIPVSLEGRATQSIPPSVRRAVVRAFHRRCAVPGCGNATWLDVHHIRHRGRGGDHAPGNLVLLCSTHHRRVHDGQLGVERDGGRLLFRHGDGTPYRSNLFWRWSAPQLPA